MVRRAHAHVFSPKAFGTEDCFRQCGFRGRLPVNENARRRFCILRFGQVRPLVHYCYVVFALSNDSHFGFLLLPQAHLAEMAIARPFAVPLRKKWARTSCKFACRDGKSCRR